MKSQKPFAAFLLFPLVFATGCGKTGVRILVAASWLLLASGCGLDHYEQQLEAEQKRLKYLDDENQNLEGSPLKLPEKKADDKEVVQEKDFFFRPPKNIAAAPEPKPLGLLYRYPSTNPGGSNLQEMLVAVVRTKEPTEKFRKDILMNLQSLGLIVTGPPKSRDAGGALAGNTVHYDYYELQGAGNQPGGIVYFSHGDYVAGEGACQVALVFRAAPSQPPITNDGPLMEMSLASLRVGSAAQVQHSRYKPPPPPGARNRR